MRTKHLRIAALLPLAVALSMLVAWTPTASAAPLVRSTLTGELLNEGVTRPGEEGATLQLGTLVRGNATGGLPGNWGMLLQSSFAPGSSMGEVTGFFLVRTPDQGAVYGTLAGVTNSETGNYTLAVVVLGGTRQHRNCSGAGTLRGNLDTEGQTFAGSLTLGMTYVARNVAPPPTSLAELDS
jgi:hypothetical protein